MDWRTELKEIADKILNYLLSFPEETEITTLQALKNMCGDATKAGESGILCPELSTRDLFEINLAVRKGASEKGLILDDSKYNGAPMGMSFHIPYTVRRK